VWKLADFGLSSEGSSKRYLRTKDSSGTPGYRAPELMDSGGDPAMYNNPVDIWAMGCILYELVTGVRAFKTDWHVLNYGFSKKNVEVVLDDSFDAHSVQIITKHVVDMLQIDPSDRPSASFLSKEFEWQLQLSHHDVLLSATTDSIALVANSEFRQGDEDESGLVSLEKAPMDVVEEYPPEVSATKLCP
jgi:serine/threonine protein kinase